MAGHDFLAEYHGLEAELADPALHADMARSRKVGRRYAELRPIVQALTAKQQLEDDLGAARELAAEDPAFGSEVDQIQARLSDTDATLARLLAPRDPNDSHDCIMEIKSGEGGEESALFAKDLFDMYVKYIEAVGWNLEVLDSQMTDLGGFKTITFAVKSTANVAEAPYGVLKFEGGVHRVQRVPLS